MSFKDLEGQLARWSKRLQQCDFQIIYWKGILHGNADALSRLCAAAECQYCAKPEAKETIKLENSVARIVLCGKNFKTWRQEQLEDPSIAIILHRRLGSGHFGRLHLERLLLY